MPHEWVIVCAIMFRSLGCHLSGFLVLFYHAITLFFHCLSHAMFGFNRCSVIPLIGLVCIMHNALRVGLFWLCSILVLDSFWHDLGLFWIILAICFMFCMAMVWVPWLVPSFKPFLHDLLALFGWFSTFPNMISELTMYATCPCLSSFKRSWKLLSYA